MAAIVFFHGSRGGKHLGWYGGEGAVEIVNAFDQVGGEAGDSIVAGSLYVPFRDILKVSEASDGTEVFILCIA